MLLTLVNLKKKTVSLSIYPASADVHYVTSTVEHQ